MIDNELLELMENYEAVYLELKPHIDQLDEMKRQIQNAIKERGEAINHGAVVTRLRSGYDRTTWDSKALYGYMQANPEIAKFCKVKAVGPSASVSVKA